ncbi:restriction endonuclease subunit S [Edwardsiella tarda]
MESLALMPKYEVYKNSGEDWIGDIPSGWDLVPIRSIFKFRNEKNSPVKTEEILSLSIANGVTKYSDKGRGGNKRKDDISAYKIAHPKDIVLNSMNVIVGAVGMSKYHGAISPVYYALYTESEDVLVEYYEKIFLNEGFQRGLLKFGKGILIKLSGTGKLNTIRMKVSTDDLKSLYFPKPPIAEQNLIFSFLDKKTAQIDEAISIKEQQINLLKERNQIIIQKAVTQGLNSNVLMKDTGIDWIGKIPEHWDISLAKYILKKLNRPRKKNGDTVICSNHGCSKLLGEVNQGLVSLTQHDYQGVDDGDLLVHGMDAWHGAIAISEHTGDCTSVVHVCDSHFNKVYIAYFLKMLAIMNVYKVISNGVRGNTSDFRSWSKFGEIQIILPPMDEQAAIVELLSKQIQDTERAIEMFQNQIAALKEYKASFIHTVVTGKVKVTPEMVEQ